MADFQRRHYEAIAATLKGVKAEQKVIDAFVSMFEADNANFDRERFNKAVGG